MGGYAYLHRRVPVYEVGQVEDEDPRYNYVIAPVGTAMGHPVAVDHGLGLFRRENLCTPDPNFDWHLN